MNKLFFLAIVFLLIGSVITIALEPSRQVGHPVIYWKSDLNPQRIDQVEIFNRWLCENHPELASSPGSVPAELRLDLGSTQSIIIQAVSGIGADILDHTPVPVYHEMKVISDIEKYAEDGNFGLDSTYLGIAQSLCTYDGVQVGYPCNAAVYNLWLNKDTFSKYGVELPKKILTNSEFEILGKEFIRKANRDRKKQDVYFCQYAGGMFSRFFCYINARSQGHDLYNETRTACTMNDQRFVDCFKLLYKWTYVDKIMASAAAQASANTEGGYGGAASSLFIDGRYAVIFTGRYQLIRLRELTRRIQLTNIRMPQDGPFENMIIMARISALYAGSKHPELAKCFFEFLAGKEYNDYIIRYADGLPPNPKHAFDNPEFLSPSDYPNENDVHANELEWAVSLGLPRPASPYYVSTGRNWLDYAFEKLMNNQASAEDALREGEERVNAGIRQTVKENPGLAKKYARDCALQEKIDNYKSTGKKIPVNWIKNPFYKKYYAKKGMLAPVESCGETEENK